MESAREKDTNGEVYAIDLRQKILDETDPGFALYYF